MLDTYEPRLELYNWQLGIKHMPVLGNDNSTSNHSSSGSSNSSSNCND